MTLEEERRALEEERRLLEREQEVFARRVEIEDRRLEQQQQLFEMKFKILEEELHKLAVEKEHVEKQKQFYYRVKEFQEKNTSQEDNSGFNIVKGEMFFSGVGNKQSLRKRYRDLIKIYHPDNVGGDNNTIQEINREYDQLSKVFG